jgi:hypothetical protein
MTQAASDMTVRSSDSRPAFADAPAVAARLVRAVSITVAAVAVIMAGVVVLARSPGWRSAFLPAVIVTLVAAIVSLPALVWGVFGTYYRAVGGWLVGMVLRGLLTAAGLLAAVVVWHRSPLAMLLLVTPLYFAQLAGECAVLVRALRNNG